MLLRDEVDQRLPFANRAEAGRILGARLSPYARREDVVVLGLPRGGIPVAFEVAAVLHAPLDACVVRKLGAPSQPELAMGAIAAGGVRSLDPNVVRALGVSRELVEKVAARELREVERQEALYRGGRPAVEIRGKTVILVDDGIATGSCMRAAVEAVRRQGAARIVVAVPVTSPGACARLRTEADELVTVAEPERFSAVSEWYKDFSQTTDEEVCDLLQAAAAAVARAR